MDQKSLEAEVEIAEIKKDIEALKREDTRQVNDYTEKLDSIERKLDKANDQLDMYRHFTYFIRSVLIGIIMILTLKFGDIKEFFMGADL